MAIYGERTKILLHEIFYNEKFVNKNNVNTVGVVQHYINFHIEELHLKAQLHRT